MDRLETNQSAGLEGARDGSRTVRPKHLAGMVCLGILLAVSYVIILAVLGAFDEQEDEEAARVELTSLLTPTPADATPDPAEPF